MLGPGLHANGIIAIFGLPKRALKMRQVPPEQLTMQCIKDNNMNHSKVALSRTFALSVLVAAMLAAPASADAPADINALLQAGRLAEALSKADAFLGERPRDAQMRFLKGLILTEQNKRAEAISLFTKLTEDYPELPEPYNNLAVLYASGGQYDHARAALEIAVRNNPSYTTAYENLGDVYARLASQTYNKVLQLEPGNANAKLKYSLIRSVTNNTGSRTQPPTIPPVPATAVPVASTPSAKAEPERPRSEASSKVTATPEAKPTARSQSEVPADRGLVLATVNEWARAWSTRDATRYLSFYSDDFRTPGGQSRAKWEAQRRARIDGKENIDIKIESPEVSLRGTGAQVSFRQIYVSNALSSTDRKTLVMTKQGEKWKITQERVSK